MDLKRISVGLFISLTIYACNISSRVEQQVAENNALNAAPVKAEMVSNIDSSEVNIRIGLLLDTSGSMNGLIDQAKSQLWKIVNKLAVAKKDTVIPNLKIALYEYGNDGIESADGYIRLVTAMTSDLDQISEDLFSLTTDGGEEYCGHAINKAVTELEWSVASSDLQLLFIAGNEPFNQGNVSYLESCELAKNKSITVNTIYCGDYKSGIDTYWKDGADLGEGAYMNIDHNKTTVYFATPFDDDINRLNSELNDTYIYYGETGLRSKEKQESQDKNAGLFGSVNSTERVISKSNYFYKNERWDLVDASDQKGFDIKKIDKKTLPDDLGSHVDTYILEYIKTKKKERIRIKKEIAELAIKREEYIKSRQQQDDKSTSLDDAMLAAIEQQGRNKGFDF